ncbi:MAG TPA: CBS domain-containing protein [Actinophytocola sp.]|uniref:CBS domain-containing protein n=1 Tax=Actinophytocola sp. TaxID=1872138 RepID=UPI002DBE7557|nr:CBS domain-containing protein [Actinophytocola sp.]HEU5470882.1 CBS domain-containing protein [Actinophytocola sp.]
MRARDIMTSPVVTIRPEATIQAAAALLTDRGFTALPVVDEDDRLVGIVTEADLVRDRILPDPRDHLRRERVPRAPSRSTVGEVMTSPAVAMSPGTDVAQLAAALLEARQRSMPIVDGSRLVGIVTRRDLVRVVGRSDTDIARDVKHRLEIYGRPGRWTVQVRDGVVTVGDEYDDATDGHVAVALAEAVPGVVRAEVSGPGG